VDVAVPPTAAGSSVGSPRLRRIVLGLLAGLLLVALAVTAVELVRKGTGGDATDPSVQRELALGRAQDVVTRFNTYGPDLLDSSGAMPKYEELSKEMTAKFGQVFLSNSKLAAATVKQTQVRRTAQVVNAGIASIDNDTAEVIVAGTARFAYPNPKKKGTWVDFDPKHFRYVVSLVEQHGQWLVDDIDDIDDGLPSFGESMGDQGGQSGLPSGQPSTAPSLSGSSTSGGDR